MIKKCSYVTVIIDYFYNYVIVFYKFCINDLCIIVTAVFINCVFAGLLRQKDEEQAILLEEKMALQLRLLAAAGLDPPSPPPSYRHLVSEQADTGVMWKEVLAAVQV